MSQTYLTPTQPGARATVTAVGRGGKWHLCRGPVGGKARLYLDGRWLADMDLYSPTWEEVVFQRVGSVAGRHTVTIEVAPKKNPSSRGYVVDIDALEVVP